MDIIEKIKNGDIRAIARTISRIERREPEAMDIIREIYPLCGRAHLIGITGPPGVGKSCLVSELAAEYRKRGRTVGILAVDPTSPFSGGALLGDRARMMDVSGDREVYIRSLGSRGATGGLSAVVNDAADVLDVAGKDVILIETVGAGQGEIAIARLAHTVLLVLMPGYGDTLQALKAGIMEIADIFVINKSDKTGADQTVAELSAVQEFHCDRETKWTAPIVKTSAISSTGIDELADEAERHYRHLKEEGDIASRNRERRTMEFLDVLTDKVRSVFLEELKTDMELKAWTEKIGRLELDPYSACDQVMELVNKARGKRA